MYIYFDTNGTIKEIVNDKSIRQGSTEANKIYCYIEGNPTIDDIWYMQKLPSGETSNEVSFKNSTVTRAIPYDAKRDMRYFKDFEQYTFYVFTLNAFLVSQKGLNLATIRIVVDNEIFALGELTFNVQENVINVDNGITISQYDYLLLAYASRTLNEQTANDLDALLDDKINAKIGDLANGSPKVFDTEANIEAMHDDEGIAVATDTGYIYVWNDTQEQYISTGMKYIADVSLFYTKTEADNKFAPKSTAITHTGSQLQDYSGNDVYPNIDNRMIDFTKSPYQYGLKNHCVITWEMGMIDHNNLYNSTVRCRTNDYMDLPVGKFVVHLQDTSIRFYLCEYLNGTFVQTEGWKYTTTEFYAKRGYQYKLCAGLYPEVTLSDMTLVTNKITVFIDKDWGSVIQNPKDAVLKGICHRGMRELAPENSIYAFSLAKKFGFAYIETDVQFTSDNVPVMFHDDYINDKSSYTGENKRISDFTYAQLQTYDFGSWFSSEYTGLKILSFDDFLTCMKQLDLIPFIEIKTPSSMTSAQCQILYDKVVSRNMKYQVYWLGYDILSLARLREIDNDMNFAPAVTSATISSGLSGFDTTFPNPHDLVIFTNYANMNDTSNGIFIRDNKKCGVWAVDSDSTVANLLSITKYCCEYFQSDGINVIETMISNNSK